MHNCVCSFIHWEQCYICTCKIAAIIAISQLQILNGDCGRSFCPIPMSFGTCVNTKHINMCVQGKLDRCHNFGIIDPQSWEKSRIFTIFAIFVIFDQLRPIGLWATFLRFHIKPSLLHYFDLYQYLLTFIGPTVT